MKMRKRVLPVLLALVLLAGALSGCGGKKADTLAGDWTAELDFGEMVSQELAGEEVADYLTTEGWMLQMDFSFQEDGGLQMKVDQASMEQLAETMKSDLKEAVTKMLEEMAEEEGTTLDELLESADMDIDTMMESFDMDPAEIFGEENMEFNGKYAVKDNKLYTTDTGEPDTTGDDYISFELKGDELHLTGSPDEDSSGMEGLLPLVLKKK